MVEKLFDKICLNKKNFIIFIFILTLISSINLFHSGLVYSDDICFHLHRIMGIVDNIKIGKYVPVYFNYLNGFGYANGLFYPDLFLFIPAILNYMGLNLIFSLKIFIFIVNFVSLFTMYLCVYRITKEKKCAYVSIILCAFSNYRLIDFVSRGSLGEMMSFAFFPLVILGLYEVFFGDCKKGYFITIGLSCLCFSHVISFYLMCFLTVLFILINIKSLKDKNRLKYLFFYILLAMIVTIHFWLPMLEQLIFDEFSISINSKIFTNIIPFYYLLCDLPISENYPVGIGFIYYLFIFKYFKLAREDRFLFTIIVLILVSILFISFKFLWKIDLIYKLFSFIQFPWRFYMFSSLFFIIGFSIVYGRVGFNKFFKFSFIYFIVIFLGNVMIYSYNIYIDEPIKNEIMMGEYLPKDFRLSLMNDFSNKNIDYVRHNDILHVSVLNDVDEIELPLLYYNGYKACDEGICFNVFKTSNGLVGVKLNENVSELIVWYSGTKIYSVTKYISLFGIIILMCVIKKFR